VQHVVLFNFPEPLSPEDEAAMREMVLYHLVKRLDQSASGELRVRRC
jgi:hypothetical protein